MFRNRSFGLVAMLAVLAVVTLIFGTAIGSPPAATNNTNIAERIRGLQEKRLAAKEAQLEQLESARLGASASTSTTPTGWVYHYDALNNKWYAYHYATTPTGSVIDDTYELVSNAPAIPARPKGYAELKEVQLEQLDARIGTVTFSIQVPTIDGCRPHRDVLDCQVR